GARRRAVRCPLRRQRPRSVHARGRARSGDGSQRQGQHRQHRQHGRRHRSCGSRGVRSDEGGARVDDAGLGRGIQPWRSPGERGCAGTGACRRTRPGADRATRVDHGPQAPRISGGDRRSGRVPRLTTRELRHWRRRRGRWRPHRDLACRSKDPAMKVVHTKDVPWGEGMQRGSYFQRRKKLAGEAISCRVWELLPGKKSYPFHKHNVTEEALLVISVSAIVRSSTGLTEIGPGDFVLFPPGDDAHQLINDGSEVLVYFAMSVSKGVDITEYPDSGKVHAAVGAAPNLKSLVYRQKDAVGYFDGEPDAE